MLRKITLATLFAFVGVSSAFAGGYGYNNDNYGSSYNSDYNTGYRAPHCHRQPVWGWDSYGRKVIVDYREICD